MAKSKYDAEIRAHKDWLSLLQPVGLVVSPPALKKAQATPNANVVAEQQRLIRLALPLPEAGQSDWVSTESAEHARIAHFPTFAVDILGWRESDLVERPADLAVPVLDHDDVLQPSWGVKGDDGSWMLLVREEAPHGEALDVVHEVHGQEWEATPQARFERLLRETKVHVGILTNGTQLRLVYAPAGESSGHVTFPVSAMCRSNRESRDILAAMLMLLGAPRLWMKPEKELLPFILKESRKYQAEVTTKLADQVLDGLRELVNGFQSAHVASGGLLLQEMQRSKAGCQEIYGGLLASILRSVFVLYAEDRGLMPQHETYRRGYSLTHLFEKLREDAALYPDTMDQRYGAWTQLLALFRLIFDGAEHGPLTMPAREGKLFNPDTYPFLEGRPWRTQRVLGDYEHPPRVSDGVVYRVLERLLILDGERLSYRALDVEQIGSVYEALMGFDLEVAHGASIAVKPKHVVVDLDAIVKAKASERDELLKAAEVKAVPKEVKAANTVEELVAALDKALSPRTPGVIPMGAMFLQPGEERRRSGSHYTPRALTEPIVATTLRPIVEQMGTRPKPRDILALKVCDPAMGSGAFLVEACRQLADKLVIAWNQHPLEKPNFKGEEMVLRARREVAQRCLYGVDKNPFAVDLAKLSLWLATLAQDHPFTFLDHSLKCGDSLVGLTKDQIVDMAWPGMQQLSVAREKIEAGVKAALEEREGIFALGDSDDVHQKQRYLNDAEGALADVRLIGDAVLAAFLVGGHDKQRMVRLDVARTKVQQWLDGSGARGEVDELVNEVLGNEREREGARFHWEVEFPEVFLRTHSGFDAFMGNPPFMGGKVMPGAFGPAYCELVKCLTTNAKGAADIVAYFFRRAFRLLGARGTLGFLSTNSISETVSRRVGLDPLLAEGASIFEAQKNIQWPGDAAVVVSRICISKTTVFPVTLNGRAVSTIGSTLHEAIDLSSARKLTPEARFSAGIQLYGDAFILTADIAAQMTKENPGLSRWLRIYVNGDVLNGTPNFDAGLLVADFGELEEEQIAGCAGFLAWLKPQIVSARSAQTRQVHETRAWLHWDKRTKFFAEAKKRSRLLVCASPSTFLTFQFIEPAKFCMQDIVIFDEEDDSFFAVMQSQVHEAWAYAIGGTLGKALRYSTQNIFRTFPMPGGWRSDAELLRIGRSFHERRQAELVARGIGLTALMGLFHDRDEQDAALTELRKLRETLDAAVLRCFGWSDLSAASDFVCDEDDDPLEEGGGRRRRKPWRYQWTDDVRDEVLARLMKLNAERYAEEQRIGVDRRLVADAAQASDANDAKPAKKKATRKKKDANAPDLFGSQGAEAGDE